MKSRSGDTRIVPATKKDIPLIRELILELAEYERASREKHQSEKDLAELCWKRPLRGLDRMWERPAGFALFLPTIPPGSAARLYRKISSYGRARKQAWGSRCCGRGSPAPSAIAGVMVGAPLNELRLFYQQIGARSMDDWTSFRLTGDALAQIAGERKKAVT